MRSVRFLIESKGELETLDYTGWEAEIRRGRTAFWCDFFGSLNDSRPLPGLSQVPAVPRSCQSLRLSANRSADSHADSRISLSTEELTPRFLRMEHSMVSSASIFFGSFMASKNSLRCSTSWRCGRLAEGSSLAA
jgi:hypothetical protein